MVMGIDTIKTKLFEKQDLSYKDFHCKLMPGVHPDTVIGVRIPMIRSLARELKGTKEAEIFLRALPHTYYEENNLHAFLIAQIRDFHTCVEAINRFLPFINNWATCDSLRPACFGQNYQALLPYIEQWLQSGHSYTVRFGIEMLMTFYLDDHFEPAYLRRVGEVRSDEYYVNMMIAWYFATALAKQWDFAVVYLEQNRLPVWVHNKTIQKAIESYRITAKQKDYLRTLRIRK